MQAVIKICALLCSATIAACVTAPPDGAQLVISPESRSISGWISVKGEWTVFPEKLDRSYNPYATDEAKKCVSIVNDTKTDRSNFKKFHGKYVKISGFIMEYNQLQDGVTPYDKLLSKKFYNGELVDNFCLRKFVFIANKIEYYSYNERN